MDKVNQFIQSFEELSIRFEDVNASEKLDHLKKVFFKNNIYLMKTLNFNLQFLFFQIKVSRFSQAELELVQQR